MLFEALCDLAVPKAKVHLPTRSSFANSSIVAKAFREMRALCKQPLPLQVTAKCVGSAMVSPQRFDDLLSKLIHPGV